METTNSIKVSHSTVKFVPKMVIDVHTSGKTLGRMQMYESYWNSDIFCITDITPRTVIATQGVYALNNSNLTYSRANFIKVDSNDIRDTMNGLVKRVDFATSDFLTSFPHTPWLFRATDDTFLLHDLVLNFIQNVSTVYDPFRHVIFFSSTTNLKNTFYVQGGCGWLMSRAFVEYLYKTDNNFSKYFRFSYWMQDDTTLTLIANRIFKSRLTWDWMNFIGSAFHESFDERNRQCPPGVRVSRLNSAIVHHLGLPHTDGIHIFEKARNADDSVFFFNYNDTQSSKLCRNPRVKDIEDATAENIKRRAELLEIKDLPNSLYKDGELKEFNFSAL